MKFEDIEPLHRRLTTVDWDILTEAAYGFYVEVGTNHGASALAASQKADKVLTIDIFDWQPKVYNTDKITFFKGTSLDYAKVLAETGELIDVLFIDGSHEFEYVYKDCEALYPYVRTGGTVMFHDHNPNNPATGVYMAVNQFLANVPHTALPKIPGSSNLLRVVKN